MKKIYIIIMLLAFVFSSNIQSQTEFKKDSTHVFQWDNNIDDWRHNTREYLTYNNGGLKETNLKRQFISGNNWVNFYQFNKVYSSNGVLAEIIQQNWNDPNSGWNDKNKHVYAFDDGLNETLHQYLLYYSGVWENYQREIKSYINNYLDIKTMEQYDAALMEFVPEEQYLYNYTDDLLDYEIKRIYFPDVSTWEHDERIDYTYNTNRQLLSIEYFGFNSTTDMFSESPYKKIMISYTSEGLVEESITQLWASSGYVNTERFAYSYLDGNQTELLLQNWSSIENDWNNTYRHLKTYDSNDNEIEFIYENWNTTTIPNAWKGFLRIVNFWSMSETLAVANYNEEASITIYPNPVSGYLNIDSNKTINNIELYDLLGRKVLETNQTEQIDVSNLNAGVFLLKITSEHKIITNKIIIK